MRYWHLLFVVAGLYCGVSALGITWGLPSRNIDQYLFGGGEVWSGQKIYRLANASEKFSSHEQTHRTDALVPSTDKNVRRGADVDVDPIKKESHKPVLLTATDEDVAKIYLRYRLYTYQPDEMITMMALAGMRPGKLRLDPKLYQYGGLFIYPVGVLIKLCDMVDLIDVRGDVVYYLDHPDEFGKFYIVARAYVATWGLVGILIVFAITRRIASDLAGIIAAALFAFMPVVVCMSHEGKPHLPGAVLMLMAVLSAIRSVSQRSRSGRGRANTDARGTPPGDESTREQKRANQKGNRVRANNPVARDKHWWTMCACCGAALGMVLSSWPIFVLIPLVTWMTGSSGDLPTGKDGRVSTWLKRTTTGTLVGVFVYLIVNPYIPINLLTNREVLASNFGNSMAMYDVARIAEGFLRVIKLTGEGATLPVLILGTLALVFSTKHQTPRTIVLVVPGVLFFLQFVLIGAGKPAEYGRFGIFPNTILAVGAACIVTSSATYVRRARRAIPAILSAILIGWSGAHGWAYLDGFLSDASDNNTRINLAKSLAAIPQEAKNTRIPKKLATYAEPAPYCFPPVDFAHVDVRLLPLPKRAPLRCSPSEVTLAPLDTSRTPMSWANKDFFDSRNSPPVMRDAIPLGR